MLGQSFILEQKEGFCLKSYSACFDFPGYCWEFELKRSGKNILYETKNDNEENALLDYKCRCFWQLMLIKPFSGLLLLPFSGSPGQDKQRETSCVQRCSGPLTCASEGFQLRRIPGLLRRIGWEEHWFSRSNLDVVCIVTSRQIARLSELKFRLQMYFVPGTKICSNIFTGLYIALRAEWQGDSPQHILLSVRGAEQRGKKRPNSVRFTQQQPDCIWVIASSACPICP